MKKKRIGCIFFHLCYLSHWKRDKDCLLHVQFVSLIRISSSILKRHAEKRNIDRFFIWFDRLHSFTSITDNVRHRRNPTFTFLSTGCALNQKLLEIGRGYLSVNWFVFSAGIINAQLVDFKLTEDQDEKSSSLTFFIRLIKTENSDHYRCSNVHFIEYSLISSTSVCIDAFVVLQQDIKGSSSSALLSNRMPFSFSFSVFLTLSLSLSRSSIVAKLIVFLTLTILV